ESDTPSARRARNREEARASAQREEDDNQSEMVAVAASYVAIAGASLAVKDLELTYAALASGNTWLCFHNGVPIFKATAATAGKHEQIFNSDVFGKAFLAQANEQGIPAAVENMGFEEIKPVIQVADFVQTEIAKQVEVQTAEVAKAAALDKAELVERFGAALALAATGITKNFFKGQTNPIANQLIESLSAVGLDNAAGLVNSAFAQNGEPYHKALLAQACKIMSYGLDAQNEIAQAVNDFNNVEATAAVAPVSMGRPVQVTATQTQEKVAATASATTTVDFQSLLQNAVSGLGKR
ncbi:MAG: hypothetical protein J6N20_11945, partial [Pseudomonas sp.]|nr:hypothetical protein [Pseudomonas sp.]